MSEAKFNEGSWSWDYDNESASIIQVVSYHGDVVCTTQSEDDAHLIAAAPKMYEMLEHLSSIDSEDAKLYMENSSDIIDLLAKARGEHD